MNFKERIINGIYGQAVADAVGNPFEFIDNFTPADVLDYADSTSKLVQTDDTQMALFGFEAINNLPLYGNFSLEQNIARSFTDSYVDWWITQEEPYYTHSSYEGLLSFKSMWSVQSPGYTCLSALKTLLNLGEVVNDSCGCGSVMRLLPIVSLYTGDNLREIIKLGQITGALTHKHKENDLAIERYITDACIIVSGGIPINRYPNVTEITQLGDGWTSLSCVEMAIWAYNNSSTYDELLTLSICHPGDSDSVAAVAGSLWGLSGHEVPEKYISKIDALDAIKYVISLI